MENDNIIVNEKGDDVYDEYLSEKYFQADFIGQNINKKNEYINWNEQMQKKN